MWQYDILLLVTDPSINEQKITTTRITGISLYNKLLTRREYFSSGSCCNSCRDIENRSFTRRKKDVRVAERTMKDN